MESVHKLDVIIGSKASYREVFKPENISLRNKYVQLCVCLQSEHHLATCSGHNYDFKPINKCDVSKLTHLLQFICVKL